MNTQLYLVQLLVDLITRASVGEEPNFVNKLLLLCFAVFFITLFSSVYSNYLTVFRQKMDAEANERMQSLIIRKAAVIKMEYFEQNDFYDRFNRARSMASRNTLRVFNYTNNFLSGLISAITAAVILFSNRIWIAGAVIVIESVYILLWVKMSDIVVNETRINTPEMRKLDFLSGLFAQKSAIQDIKLNGSAAFLERKQNVLYQSIIKRKKEVGKKNLVIQMLVTFTEIFCKYGLYLLYAYRALRGLITPGQFTYLFGVSQNLMHIFIYNPCYHYQNTHPITGLFVAPVYDENNILKVQMMYNNKWSDERGNQVIRLEDSCYEIKIENNGYKMNLKLKWELFEIDFHTLNYLGMDVILNDVDTDEPDLDTVQCWSNISVQLHNPSRYGMLRF